jgi:hypothetical protein
VEYRFNADEWTRMTPAQRIARCMILAEEAQKLANASDKKFKSIYLQLVHHWLTIAGATKEAQKASRRNGEAAHGASRPRASLRIAPAR